MIDDDTLYPYINNDIEYRLFEDQCDHNCYSHQWELTVDNHSISCTHAYNYIVQHMQDLCDSTQQHTLFHGRERVIIYR